MELPKISFDDFYKFVTSFCIVMFVLAAYASNQIISSIFNLSDSADTRNVLWMTYGILIGVALISAWFFVWAVKKWYKNQKLLDEELEIRIMKERINLDSMFTPKWKKKFESLSPTNIINKKRNIKEIKINKGHKYSSSDLSDFPSLFENIDGSMNFYLVISDNASKSEIDGAVAILGTIQHHSIKRVYPKYTQPESFALLASELKNKKIDKPIISIGNPDVNPITAKIIDYKEGEEFQLPENTGIIKLHDYQNQTAIVIIGSDSESINAATKVLADFDKNKLKGTEIIVKTK